VRLNASRSALVFHVGDKDYRTPHRDRRRLSKVERFDRSFRGRSFENGPLSERKGATQFRESERGRYLDLRALAGERRQSRHLY
jgi:hypothetical protein